jgi:hypothetical protein
MAYGYFRRRRISMKNSLGSVRGWRQWRLASRYLLLGIAVLSGVGLVQSVLLPRGLAARWNSGSWHTYTTIASQNLVLVVRLDWEKSPNSSDERWLSAARYKFVGLNVGQLMPVVRFSHPDPTTPDISARLHVPYVLTLAVALAVLWRQRQHRRWRGFEIGGTEDRQLSGRRKGDIPGQCKGDIPE